MSASYSIPVTIRPLDGLKGFKSNISLSDPTSVTTLAALRECIAFELNAQYRQRNPKAYVVEAVNARWGSVWLKQDGRRGSGGLVKVEDRNVREVLESIWGDRWGALVVDVRLVPRINVSSSTDPGCSIDLLEAADAN